MKKYLFLVVVACVAAVCWTTAAYAIDVTLSGEAAVRSRWFINTQGAPSSASNPTGSSATATGNVNQDGSASSFANGHADRTIDAYTQTHFLLEVNIKADNNIKGKLALFNDWDDWGGSGRGAIDQLRGYGNSSDGSSNSNVGNVPANSQYNQANGSSAFIREAWIDFMVPGTPVGLKTGRMLGQLGQGWFERSQYGGQDAWLLYVNLGPNTIAFQDVKMNEGATNQGTATVKILDTSRSFDDVDLYSIIGTFKPSDSATVSVDLSYLNDRMGMLLLNPNGQSTLATGVVTPSGQISTGTGDLWNLGLSYNVKAGPATIKGEFDFQNGHVQNFGSTNGGVDYNGYQGIVMASVPVGMVTFNFNGAYGSGTRPGSSNNGQFMPLLDITQHYTYIYEYRLKTAAGSTYLGFANTTALSAGLMVQASKSIAVGFDTWWLQASEYPTAYNQTSKTFVSATLNGVSAKANSKDLGVETDVKINWQISPNLSWNWQLCWWSIGNAYKNNYANGGFEDDIYTAQGVLMLKF
jgi:hypothetical protein